MLEILIVDDEQEIANSLRQFFVSKGYTVTVANDGNRALEVICTNRPHLVFLDIRMPGMDGLAVLRHIREADRSIKVIMVTAFGTKEIVEEALRLGAVDFIRKPFTVDYLERDVIKKVNVQLFEDLRQEIEDKNGLISQMEQLHERISRNFYQTVLSLATALESRDRYTHGHSERVETYSKLIAGELKRSLDIDMDKDFLEALHIESRLHDIGKIAVPDEILNKPSALTCEERLQIQRHPEESVRILACLDGIQGNIDVIYSHHEHVDGSGYPCRKSSQEIPLRARIISVADAFDAMTSDRPYRQALSVDAAMQELESGKGGQFDGNVVDAFVKGYRKLRRKLDQDDDGAVAGAASGDAEVQGAEAVGR